LTTSQIDGAFFTPNTIDPVTKMRSYATTSYYLPSADRENLTVVVSTLVTQVMFDHDCDKLKATGVKVSSSGEGHTVWAKKEVILSAG
jgi:choline dehydrogenase-like flavoprotein